jgi:hypothetical protein
MIPPKIKKLPGLRKPNPQYIQKPEQGSVISNKGGFVGTSKMVR